MNECTCAFITSRKSIASGQFEQNHQIFHFEITKKKNFFSFPAVFSIMYEIKAEPFFFFLPTKKLIRIYKWNEQLARNFYDFISAYAKKYVSFTVWITSNVPKSKWLNRHTQTHTHISVNYYRFPYNNNNSSVGNFSLLFRFTWKSFPFVSYRFITFSFSTVGQTL